MGQRPVNVKVFRRALRVRRAFERSELRRIPGVSPIARGVWKALLGDSPRDDRVIVRTRGVTLEIPASRFPNYVAQDYEPVTTKLFLSAIERGAVIVDVGAHIGYYSCLAARAAGPTGSVHAIEPAPENFEVLCRNAGRNQFGNIAIHHLAAAAAAGSRRFLLTDASDSHGFYDHPLAHFTGALTVETRPVDDLIDSAARVIKIDVEGAELEVLNGMQRLLGMSPGATVFVEWNPECLAAAKTTPDELPALMDTLGVAEIAVIDDRRQLIRSLSEVQEEMKLHGVPHGWYVNLYGTVR